MSSEAVTADLIQGDICTYQRTNGVWGFFWILKIDCLPGGDRVFSLRKFDVHTTEEIKRSDINDVEELKQLPLNPHFPIFEAMVMEARPSVIGNMPVTEQDLQGYYVWKKEFDRGHAGVFTLKLDEI